MKCHSSSSIDRISELPCNITPTILMFIPLEDMVRTSVLSRNWRFQWTKVPQLIFVDRFVKRYTAERVFGILLLHEGPILKFTLGISYWDDYSKINEIIRYLSRNGIQELKISKTKTIKGCYTLPSSIFSCVELKYLSLYSCVVKPLTFDGFNKLITLELLDIELGSHVFISSCPSLESLTMDINTKVDRFSVDAPKLKFLSFRGSISSIGFMNTPLLKVLSLTGDCDTHEESSLDLMELLCPLPCLENLLLDYLFLKSSLSVSPNKPTVLNNLRKLELIQVSLNDKGEFLSILWLIRNSPNLLRLKFEHPQALDTESERGLKIQDPSLYHLVKLQELEMGFHPDDYNNLRPDIEFMKFLLDISPELEKFYISPSSEHLDERQSKMLLELACYRRASPKAEIVLI